MSGSDAWLGVRLTRKQHRDIKDRAKAAGLTVSDYVRIRCTTDPDGPVIRTDAEALRRVHANLRRAGSNLNQVARELNARHRPNEVEDDLRKTLNIVAKASEDVSNFIADARRSI